MSGGEVADAWTEDGATVETGWGSDGDDAAEGYGVASSLGSADSYIYSCELGCEDVEMAKIGIWVVVAGGPIVAYVTVNIDLAVDIVGAAE